MTAPTTPTTTRVLAAERMPAQYQPGMQARMTRMTAGAMLPGLGNVRRGNGMSSNGLNPTEDQIFANQMRMKNARERRKAVRQRLAQLRKALIQAEAMMDKAAGRSMPPAKAATLVRYCRQLQRSIEMTQGLQGFGMDPRALPPWQRMPIVPGPATPAPDAGEPGGISTQRDRATILAMQSNVSPVQQYVSEGQRRRAAQSAAAYPLYGMGEDEAAGEGSVEDEAVDAAVEETTESTQDAVQTAMTWAQDNWTWLAVAAAGLLLVNRK